MRLSPPLASAHLEKEHGIKRSHRTLANYRRTGGGPRYIRVSPTEVLYESEDLDSWANQLTAYRHSHTAEENFPKRGAA